MGKARRRARGLRRARAARGVAAGDGDGAGRAAGRVGGGREDHARDAGAAAELRGGGGEAGESAEAEVKGEIAASVGTLEAACDATVDVLQREKHYYSQHAPELHRDVGGPAERAGATSSSRRRSRAACGACASRCDGAAEVLRLCEARLHQATDYQVAAARGAGARAERDAGVAADAGGDGQARDGARARAVADGRRESLRAETLQVASSLHAALVEAKVLHDELGEGMRGRLATFQAAHDEVARAFVLELREGTAAA